MADPPTSIDQWRDYFRSINTSLFNIIEHAIILASKDYPYDFKIRRDRIAEVLYASKVIKCISCDQIELAVPAGDDDALKKKKKKNGDVDDSVMAVDINESIPKARKARDNHVNMCGNADGDGSDDDVDGDGNDNGDDDDDSGDGDDNGNGDGDELEETSQFLREVLKIKEIIDSDDTSDEELVHCLRRLKLMNITVETLKESEIGKSINMMRKRRSHKEIRSLTAALIEDWIAIVDGWLLTTKAAITDAKLKDAQIESPEDALVLPKDEKPEPEVKKQVAPSKTKQPQQNNVPRPKPPSSNGQPKQTLQPKVNAVKPKLGSKMVPKKPMPQRESKEPSMQKRLELTKRKLRDRYQQAERVKRQRTTRAVELHHELPKKKTLDHKNKRLMRIGDNENGSRP